MVKIRTTMLLLTLCGLGEFSGRLYASEELALSREKIALQIIKEMTPNNAWYENFLSRIAQSDIAPEILEMVLTEVAKQLVQKAHDYNALSEEVKILYQKLSTPEGNLRAPRQSDLPPAGVEVLFTADFLQELASTVGPLTFVEDSGNATAAGAIINVLGGSNINTSGAGNTITINLNNSVAVSGSISAGTTVTAGTGITATTGNVTASAGSVVITSTSANANANDVDFIKNRSGGVITSGDTLGNITFKGFDGTSNITGSKIVSVSSGTIATNRIPSDLEFFTHPDSITASTQRMVINSAGNVTINTPDSGIGLTINGGGETITAGGLTVTAGGITATTGDVTISAGNLALPNTNSTGTQGVITLGGPRFFHAAGSGSNIFVGSTAGNFTVTGLQNSALGLSALQALTTGIDNTACGAFSLATLTIGSENVAYGASALVNAASGSFNTACGSGAGFGYSGSDSSNISIGFLTSGAAGESNTLRIGSGTGAGAGNLNQAFVSGINGISAGTSSAVFINASDKLGTLTGSSGGVAALTSNASGALTIATPAAGVALTINGGGQTITAGGLTVSAGGITATTGNIAASGGNVTASGTVTGGTGVTATTGNIAASSGNVTASGTVTGGTGVTATTGNIAASSGNVTASGTVTGGTGVTATTGNLIATAGAVRTAAGSAAAPSVTSTGDTTTGLYYPASGQFALSAGGVKKLQYDGTSVSYGSVARVQAYNSALQGLTGGAGDTTIVFDQQVANITSGNFSANTYTAPLSGVYRVSIILNISTAANATDFTVKLVKNAVALTAPYILNLVTLQANAETLLSASWLIFLTAGDTLQVTGNSIAFNSAILAGAASFAIDFFAF
jgi:hypothetical protein